VGEGTGNTGAPIVAVANRLPIIRERGAWRLAPGGLVTALLPAMRDRDGAWIGWDGGSEQVPARVSAIDVDLHPVELSRAQLQGYYYGFSNRTLWPLFHDLVEAAVYDRNWWQSYDQANRAFARAADRVAAGRPPVFWVHDYHLLLLPHLLRDGHPESPIGFFLHIPFPPAELFTRLPMRDELLRGMLGADHVSFHAPRYQRNFIDAATHCLDDVKQDGDDLVLADGRRVTTAAHPISIDVDSFTGLATDPKVARELASLRKRFARRRVLLGVDRMDYTKGILERLRAIELLLERRSDLRTSVAFVQVAVPSRDDVKEYRDLREHVEAEIGRINGRFTESGGDVPVYYMYRSVRRARLVAYYLLADVALVTPKKDGMNLVAKEFVVTQSAGGGSGALVLSEFAGAARELTDAVLCNPFDVEGLSVAIEQALGLSESERRRALDTMAAHVRDHDVTRWVDDELAGIDAAAARRAAP